MKRSEKLSASAAVGFFTLDRMLDAVFEAVVAALIYMYDRNHIMSIIQLKLEI